MNRKRIHQAMLSAIKAGVPTMLYGAPGVGKSQTVQALAKETGRVLYDIRASTLDPVDARGLPVPDVSTGIVKWLIPDFWPQGAEPSILFLDELTNASPSVQTALLQLVLDRKLGNYEMPKNCVVIAAGNRVQDKSGSVKLISSMRSRFLQLDFDVELADWCDWAIESNQADSVISFLRWRPMHLLDFDPRERTSPNPRAWEMVSRLQQVGVIQELEYEVFSGLVGEGAASEYTGFLRIYKDLPDVGEILADPMGSEVPREANVLYALCGTLAIRAGTDETALAVLRYAERLPKEFEVLLVSDSVKMHGKDFTDNELFALWAANNEI